MTLEFVEVKTKNIPHLIVEQIRKKIIVGSLVPGDKLPPETELAEMFGVSRSSIREALKILEGFGVIERRKRGGTFIREVTIDDLANIYTPKPEKDTMLDLLEARELIEMEIIRLIVERASDEELKELEQMNKWMKNDLKKFAENDIVFHIMLGRMSKNNVLSSIVNSIKKATDKIYSTPLDEDQLSTVLSEHTNIINALLERDIEGAQNEMRKHFATIRYHVDKYMTR